MPFQSSEVPRIDLGLNSSFAFAQLHFHWGSADGKGSEHTVAERQYPLEMHLVHYNTK